MGDREKRRREAEEAFDAAGMRFATADERARAAALCVQCCAETGTTPTELVRRWEVIALNEKHSGPVRLHKFESLVQSLRRQAVAAPAAHTSAASVLHTHNPHTHTISNAHTDKRHRTSESALVKGVGDEEEEDEKHSRFVFGEKPRVVDELLQAETKPEAASDDDFSARPSPVAAPPAVVLETPVPEYRYMDETLCRAALMRDEEHEAAIERLKEREDVAEAAARGIPDARLSTPAQDSATVFGTVICDESAGTAVFNYASCYLRAPMSEGSETVKLLLSQFVNIAADVPC